MKTVAIVGLGYVGLPLACLCAEKGLVVHGVDIDKRKLDIISQGKSPIDDEYLSKQLGSLKGKILTTSDAAGAAKKSDITIICVPTPVDKGHAPDLKPLIGACEAIVPGVHDGITIVIESTIFPGTVQEIVLPILRKSGNKFFLGHCPERIDPGNRKYTVRNLPRVVGGIDKESVEKIAGFYRSIIEADIVELSSVKAAEATKIMENTFRDVNIAFVNEMARSFDKAGIDIIEVIKGASSKPFGFLPHYPGAGVGGHCIAVDPYYLIAKAKEHGFVHEFLILARKINEEMPAYAVALLEEQLKMIGEKLSGARVGVLGLSYKGNVDDTRESPAWEVIHLLKEKEANVEVFDPHVPAESTAKDIEGLLGKVDSLILVTNHKEFTSMDYTLLRENNIKVVIDGRNCLDKDKIKALGIRYHGIGRQ